MYKLEFLSVTWAFVRQWWIKNHLLSWVCAQTTFWHHHHPTQEIRFNYDLIKIWDSLSPGRKLLDLHFHFISFHLKHLIHFRIISCGKISCTLPLLHWPWMLSYFIYICISCVNKSLWIRLHTVSQIQA